MLALRSFLFVVLFYLWWTIIALTWLPFLLLPRRSIVGPMKVQAHVTAAILRFACGVRVEFRGLERLPPGAVLIGAKHQCMFDTIAPMTVLPDAAYVMRDSLLKIPFYGWYSVKAGMIPIDRQGHASALRRMLAAAKAAIADKRQVVIFPEGTRLPVGVTGEYKPGVAALYKALGVPCVPLATNSGAHWPPHGFIRRPGLIVYEFLEPIPAGLDRREFMRLLEERVETGSKALIGL
jgi:1-acyl-sn-glycerol-3-phosphate acyltransferase